MPIKVPSPESLKEKAKLVRKFLNEKCKIDVPHGHCLELVSQLFDCKDWNTASAAFRSKQKQNILPATIKTVGDMKAALALFDDSAIIDANYEFKRGDLEELDPLEGPEDIITQEFSFVLEESAADIANFKLVLEHESLTQEI